MSEPCILNANRVSNYLSQIQCLHNRPFSGTITMKKFMFELSSSSFLRSQEKLSLAPTHTLMALLCLFFFVYSLYSYVVESQKMLCIFSSFHFHNSHR